MTDAGRPARAFRADVQGLRAIAVGAVLLYHAGVPPFTGGYVGVDVFFVISGFLISSHLLESIDRDGRIGFAQFYARRARRILPASLVVAALTTIAVLAVVPPLALPGLLSDALATILYGPNLWFAIQETDYLADHAASPFQHYWSLGVEEQFYLLWPAVLLAIVLLARRRRGGVAAGIGVVATLSFVACVAATAWNQPLAFFLLPTRAWELLVGALVAAALLWGRPLLSATVAAVGGWLGIAAVIAACTLFDEGTPFPGAAVAVPVLGTAAVIYFGSTPAGAGPTRALSLRPLQSVGLISYSLYLVHWPLLVVPQLAVGRDQPLPASARVLLGIVLAVPVAALLHRFVEEPFRAPRALASRPPRVTLIGTAALTTALAVAVAGAGSWAGTRAIAGVAAAQPAPPSPAAPPVAGAVVPADLVPSLQDVAEDVPAVYEQPGCHLDTVGTQVQDCSFGDPAGSFQVALFGDSHSAQWLPAVERIAAEGGDIAIASYTKSSCPAVDVTVLVHGAPYTSCNEWRHAVTDHLAGSGTDLVIISSYAAYPLAGKPAGAERLKAWEAGLTRTASQLRGAGLRVLVIADTPRFPVPVPECLSAHLDDALACAGDPALALDSDLAAAERAATTAAGADYVDLTGYLCDEESCPAVIGQFLVYRDLNHLTASFARYLAPALGPLR